MSTLKVTNIQHPNAEDPAIELSPSGGVLLSGVGDAPSGSTGAPWDLPFPVAGEAFGTQAIQDLAEATAFALNETGEVVQRAKLFDSNTFVTGTDAWLDVPNIEMTFTPLFDDSLIRVRFVSWNTGADRGSNSIANRTGALRFTKDGTTEFANTATGPIGMNHMSSNSVALYHIDCLEIIGEEISGDTNARTYKLQANRVGQAGTRFYVRPNFMEIIEFKAGTF